MAIIIGSPNDEQLVGSTVNDEIRGLGGNDTLDGGLGNDFLAGGFGNDTYVYRPGSGLDVISEVDGGGFDTIQILSVLPAQVQLIRIANDLVVRFLGNTDQITVTGYFGSTVSNAPVERFTFADGTVWNGEAILNRVVSNNANVATEAGDTITGTAVNNVIDGLGGNDTISGDNGDDQIFGGTGNDSLFGNGGTDSLFGNNGDDILSGGQGNDWLSGDAGNDIYVFNLGDGQDYISEFASLNEENSVQFGAGIVLDDLRLIFDGWTAHLDIGGNGNSLSFSNFFPLDQNAQQSVSTFLFTDGSSIGVDELIARGFYLGGTEGGDFLNGSPLNERIYGYGGNDTLNGDAGNDTLVGGTGFDHLNGGTGNDTYVFNVGDGLDTIWDGSNYASNAVGGFDTIRLNGAYFMPSVRLAREANDLAVYLGNDQIRVSEHFERYPYGATQGAMEQIVFSDGTIWDTAAINNRIASNNNNALTAGDDTVVGFVWNDYLNGFEGNDTISGWQGDDQIVGGVGADRLFGGEGSDVLLGEDGNDTLAGGTGNDTLDGGLGNDTYRFNLGDGIDLVNEIGLLGERNRIVFGEGIRFQDLHGGFDPSVSAYALDVGTNGDRLLIGNAGLMTVDTFQFADGTVATLDALLGPGLYWQGNQLNDWMSGTMYADSLYGNGGDDSLYGEAGNDILGGGLGNDWLNGGQGDDQYIVNLGDGMDAIHDTALPGEGNRVVFGEGVVSSDLHLNLTGPVLEIRIGITLDGLRLFNFDGLNPTGAHPVDTFEFADGSMLSFAQLLERGVQVSGTSLDDNLDGTYVNDTMFGWTGGDAIAGHGGNDSLYGEAGADTLHGGAGNDALIGGTGNDSLFGGLGSDTYVYNLGDGSDLVLELESSAGDVDRVSFGSGITAQGITVTRGGNNDYDLKIAFTGNPETLTFMGWFNPAISGQIEEFRFGDGSVLSGAQVADLVNYAPTVAQPLADQTVLEDTVFSLALPVDAFADIDNDALSFSATLAGGGALPAWLSFNSATRTFSGTPGNAEVGVLDVLVTATDPLGKSVSDSFALTVQNVNDAPYYSGPIENQFGAEGQAFAYQLAPGAFNDLDAIHGDTLTYSAMMFDGTPLPAWLSFDVASRTFSGTPADGNSGNYNITVSAADSAGASASRAFTLSVYNSIIVGTNQADTLYGSLGDEKIYGLDGNDWIRASSGNDLLVGNAGNDRLFGGNGDDILVGGTGDDMLYGSDDYPYALGSGNDTYRFDMGDGRDTILDVDSTTGNIDIIRFGAGIQQSDVSVAGVNGNLNITIGTGGDQITVQNWFSPLSWFYNGYTEAANRIERLEFADGSFIDMTSRTDILHTITGSAADNILEGGGEKNIIYALGGNDTVHASSGDDSVFGGDGNDSLNGQAGNDTLDGGAGDDTIWGEDGNDTLIGGTGVVDTLYGGYGSDTYVFNSGDGQDIIADTFANVGDADTLRFGAGITRNMLDISRSGSNIYIDLPGNDGITLYGWYFSPTYRIENLEFADGTSMTAVEIQAWADNVAPVLATPVATQTAIEDASFNFVLPAATFSDANAGDTLSYTATLADGSALPNWLQFDAVTRSFTGTPANDQVGALALRVTATDNYGKSASTGFELVVQNTNDVPTVANAVADQTANEDATFSFTVPANAFSDVDVGDRLTYSATLADGSALPAWLRFDAATRIFSGTPANGDIGSVNVLITAIDTGGATASEVFTLTVTNTNDAPVVASTIPDQTGAEGNPFSYVVPTATFSDIDVGDSLAYAATLADGSALPVWLSFNAATHTLSGNPADGTAGSYSLRVTATDSAGASVFDDFVLTVADTIVTVKNGTSSVDTLQGTAFMDALNGLGGNDTLYGYAGNDTLDGGSGSDTMYGGLGNDTYVVNSTGDIVTENAYEGTDSVNSSISYALGSNVENLTLTGSNTINATGNTLDNVLTGNSANNTLTGNAGNDWLDGGAGSDTMRGGTGNDTYVVSTSGDVVSENSNEGTDTVRTGISYTLGNNVENLTLTGAGNASGTGNSLNNVIFGNSASNTLTGNAGHDTLQGLGGNDTLKGGTGNDTYVFGRGDGQDVVQENDATTSNQDTASLGVNALDIVFARRSSNLVMSLHGGTDTLTVQNWYTGTQYQTEVIKAQDGSTLASNQVANLIQAMATFSTNNGGISWDQAITQNPNEVQAVLAAYWQPAA